MSSSGDFGPGGGDFGGGDIGPIAPSVHRGWAFLQKSVNRGVPTAAARSQALRRATLRRLAHRRRMG